MKINKKSTPFLSVIIPIYNETNRLNNLSLVYKFLNENNIDYEIVIINDGSTDKTLQKLTVLSNKYKFQLITYDRNMGKGYAIKTGMLSAKGKYRFFTDIDLSTPLEEIQKFLPFLLKYDLVIGSRKIYGSDLKKRQSLVREQLGKGFTFLSQRILDVKVSDFTCGFKFFSKKAALQIFSIQRMNRWCFDSEILFIASKLKFSIKEIPVTWKDDKRTKVKFPHDIISSFLDLIKIRYYNLKGMYD